MTSVPVHLLWRHDAEDDAFGEGVEAVDEFKLGIAAKGDELSAFVSMHGSRRQLATDLVHLLELAADGGKADHKLLEATLPQTVEGRLGGIALRRRRLEISRPFLPFAFALAVLLEDRHVRLRLAHFLCKGVKSISNRS
jgi:hypothetical protein